MRASSSVVPARYPWVHVTTGLGGPPLRPRPAVTDTLGTARGVDRSSGYSFGVKCHARLFTDGSDRIRRVATKLAGRLMEQ